jgi:Cytochrome c, mono- and diheme variants
MKGFFNPVMPVALAALLFPVTMAQAADALAGKRIADRWCTSCHVVESGSKGSPARGTDAVPTLASIAHDPQRGPDWPRQWLTSPHPPMPDLNLSRAEIEDVVAYLQSLSR